MWNHCPLGYQVKYTDIPDLTHPDSRRKTFFIFLMSRKDPKHSFTTQIGLGEPFQRVTQSRTLKVRDVRYHVCLLRSVLFEF